MVALSSRHNELNTAIIYDYGVGGNGATDLLCRLWISYFAFFHLLFLVHFH